jgi:hypothetical protein
LPDLSNVPVPVVGAPHSNLSSEMLEDELDENLIPDMIIVSYRKAAGRGFGIEESCVPRVRYVGDICNAETGTQRFGSWPMQDSQDSTCVRNR